MIEINCASCGKLLRIPDEFRGRDGKCTGCGSTVTVPSDILSVEQKTMMLRGSTPSPMETVGMKPVTDWRLEPPSERQLATLTDLGATPKQMRGLTKEQASVLIEQLQDTMANPAIGIATDMARSQREMVDAQRDIAKAARRHTNWQKNACGCVVLVLLSPILIPILFSLIDTRTALESESETIKPILDTREQEPPQLAPYSPPSTPTTVPVIAPQQLLYTFEQVRGEYLSSTSIQRDQMEKRLQGLVVAWSGEIMEVKARSNGGYLIQVEMDRSGEYIRYSDVNLVVKDRVAERLSVGQLIQFRGVIDNIREELRECVLDLDPVEYSVEGSAPVGSLNSANTVRWSDTQQIQDPTQEQAVAVPVPLSLTKVVYIDEKTYHLNRECSDVEGDTSSVILSIALQRFKQPCPTCAPDQPPTPQAPPPPTEARKPPSAALGDKAPVIRDETMVLVSATDKHYHSGECRATIGISKSINLSAAQSKGLTPCVTCKPPR